MNFFKKVSKELSKRDCTKRNREATEGALLSAAHALFAEKGYESTRTLEIAKHAGVNEALITRYFGGKEGLLVAVLKDPKWEQELLPPDGLKAKLKPGLGSVSETLEGFFKAGGEAMSVNESFLRIATSRALIDESVAESMKKNVLNRRIPEIEEGLKLLTSKSKLSEDEIQAITLLLGSSNFTLNFLAKIVYKMSPKKISLALSILSESLELFVKSKK